VARARHPVAGARGAASQPGQRAGEGIAHLDSVIAGPGIDDDGSGVAAILEVNGFNADIPFGGLFTGAEVPKTPEQVAVYGGIAGVPYDPCYHQACDTFANVDLGVLDLNSDSVATATFQYAMSTESVNGVPGRAGFRVRTPAPVAAPAADAA
jgi:Zn-dependent M28 family amino/carboxypeptidase